MIRRVWIPCRVRHAHAHTHTHTHTHTHKRNHTYIPSLATFACLLIWGHCPFEYTTGKAAVIGVHTEKETAHYLVNWTDRPSSFRERKAPVNAVHSENAKLEHTHTFAHLWVSHRGSKRKSSCHWSSYRKRNHTLPCELKRSQPPDLSSGLPSSQNSTRSWFLRKMSPA